MLGTGGILKILDLFGFCTKRPHFAHKQQCYPPWQRVHNFLFWYTFMPFSLVYVANGKILEQLICFALF